MAWLFVTVSGRIGLIGMATLGIGAYLLAGSWAALLVGLFVGGFLGAMADSAHHGTRRR